MTKEELTSKMADLKRKGELAKQKLADPALAAHEKSFYKMLLDSCRNWYADCRDKLKYL